MKFSLFFAESVKRTLLCGFCGFVSLAVVLAQENPEPVPEEQTPVVDIAAPKPAFAEAPTDEDLSAARVFLEPLIPMPSEQADPASNAALGQALTVYANRTVPDDLAALVAFVQAYPQSRWRPAVELGMGMAYRNTGHFTKALDRLESAWTLSKEASDFDARNLGNRVLGELVDLNARFGRFDRLKELFDETQSRDVSGSAATSLDGAKQGYWRMMNRPFEAFRCGPLAVNNVLDAGKANMVPNAEVGKETSTQQGTSLKQIHDLAGRAGFQHPRMVKREEGAAWVVPAVIHWKVGHFAAVTRLEKGRYLVKDPTFGGELWITPEALNEEATGYSLIDASTLPPGWNEVGEQEGLTVWGKGGAHGKNPDDTDECQNKKGGCGPCSNPPPMAQYSIFAMLAQLSIQDTPVGYEPPYGPSVDFKVVYNHLEANQPQNFPFSNLGQFWTYNWLSYLVVNESDDVLVVLRGGGAEVYNHSTYKPNFRTYDPGLKSQAVLKKIGTNNYERRLFNGMKEIYNKPDGAGRVFLTKIIDEHGNAVTLDYNSTTYRLNKIVDALGQETILTYVSNSIGNSGYYKIKQVTDPFSRSATFAYSPDNQQMLKITDIIGIESEFIYGGDGFIAKLKTPYGDTYFQQYTPIAIGDGLGRGLNVYLPDGGQECLESYTGHTMETYFWDREAMMHAPGDREAAETIHWLMDPGTNLMRGIPQWEKKALESKVSYHYPGQPEPVQAPGEPGVFHHFVGTSDLPDTVERTLDDGSDQIYRYSYNDIGQVTKYIDPIGRTFQFYYDVTGLDLYEVRQTRNGASDFLVGYSYNDKHLPVTMTDPSGRITQAFYNGFGQITQITNAKGETTTAEYYAADTGSGGTFKQRKGRIFRIDGPLSGSNDKLEVDYDGKGRVASVTRNLGPNAGDVYVTQYAYDNADRITQVTYPDGKTRHYTYDRLDLRSEKDELGRTTTYTYTALQQLASMRDPLGRLYQLDWCRCGAMKKLIDPMGRETKWDYDLQGRMVKKTYPNSSEENYAYETTISRLKTLTDPNGTVKTYGYSRDNRLASITYAEGSGVASTPDVTLIDDPDYRRLTSVASSVGTTTFGYGSYATNPYGSPDNSRGRLTSVDGIYADDTAAYGYDEIGRMISRQINGTANEETRQFDAAGRISQFSNKLGTFIPAYLNAAYGDSRPEQLPLPNGTSAKWQWYDKSTAGWLQKLRFSTSGNSTISSHEYVYNAVGQITTWKPENPADGTNPVKQISLDYDAAYQLSSAIVQNASSQALLKQYFYQYDKAGNRVNLQVDNTVTPASYNNLNQLTSTGSGNGTVRFQGILNEPGKVKVGGADAFMWKRGTNAFQFSASIPLGSGNNTVAVEARDASNNVRTNNYQVTVSSSGSQSFSYDDNGNMTSDGSRTYTWDGENRLVKIAYTGTQEETEFTYDAFFRRVKILEKNNGSTTSDKRLIWCGTQICEERNSGNTTAKWYYPEGFVENTTPSVTKYYYGKDHLGSIRELMNSSGTVVGRHDYDPYGSRTFSGTVQADFGYTGHYVHSRSGLVLTLYRAYAPEQGRWISRDPLEENGGINLYTYVFNDPENLYDPLGLVSLNLTPPAEKMTKQYWDDWSDSGKTTVAAHGNTEQIFDSNLKPISLADLADLIRETDDFKKGRPVRLYICNTGEPSSDGVPLGQKLADLLGREVEAPDGIVNIDESKAGLPNFMKSKPWVSSELGGQPNRSFIPFRPSVR